MRVTITTENGHKYEYSRGHFVKGFPTESGNYIVISNVTGTICRDTYTVGKGWEKSENDGNTEYLPKSWKRVK